MLLGLNHITFGVQSIERSLAFYRDVLGCELHARWERGAYLTVGDCWLCLSLDSCSSPSSGYGHIAFSVDAQSFSSFRRTLAEHGVEIWKHNESEGDSVYFLDPDGHRLEAHVGDLKSRLQAIRANPYEGQCVVSEL
ncbi:MAG: VOC family protein [Woeseiaceae bacterium]|nr:VOC family protein [Woeseiaceae bacterium]